MSRFIALCQLSEQLTAMPNMPILRQYVTRLILHMPLACELREVNQSPRVHPWQRRVIRNIYLYRPRAWGHFNKA